MSNHCAFFRLCLFTVCALGFCLPTVADDEVAVAEKKPKTLTIGSKAPSLDIEHWLSLGHDDAFEKVTEFKDGKIYVVEFWATWCGPCISSMPHLVETQERHADDGVQIVSISDEDLETVEKFLKRKVRQRGPKKDDDDEAPKTYGELTSAYCLTTDPDRSANNDYMKAAAQNGIPTSFIVGKSGHVEWIGHPMSIDKPLQAVVDDEWDRKSFAKEFKEKQEFALMMRKARTLARGKDFDQALELLSEAKEKSTGRNKLMAASYYQQYYGMKLAYMTKNGEADEALKLVEADIEQAHDEDQTPLRQLRLGMLLSADRTEDATEELSDLTAKLDFFALNKVTWGIYEYGEKNDGKLDPDLLATAIEAAERGVEIAPPGNETPVLDTLAHLVYLQGDMERAIELQTEAVKVMKRNMPEVKAFLKKLKKEMADSQDAEDADEEEEEEEQEDDSK